MQYQDADSDVNFLVHRSHLSTRRVRRFVPRIGRSSFFYPGCCFKIVGRDVFEAPMTLPVSRNVLDPLYASFRVGHTTQTAILKVLDDVRRMIDGGLLTFAVFFDFSKALRLMICYFYISYIGSGCPHPWLSGLPPTFPVARRPFSFRVVTTPHGHPWALRIGANTH